MGGDVYWDHPMNSSVRYETDFWPFKLATDVVLNGTACVPGGEPATSCFVSLQVGETRKSIAVTGDRVAQCRRSDSASPTPSPSRRCLFATNAPTAGPTSFGSEDALSVSPQPAGPWLRDREHRQGAGRFGAAERRGSAHAACAGADLRGRLRAVGRLPHPGRFRLVSQKSGVATGPSARVLPRDRAVEQELRQAYAQLVPAAARRI